MEESPAGGHIWRHKVSAVMLVIFCTLLGIFLVIYPWMPCEPGFPCWDDNFLVNLLPHWAHIWKSPYFRGAISGLGLVNIYVALLEAVELKRFTRHDKVPT
ncbi:MAG: hypothetical protein NTY38_03745 [Acidobacteria bacterium]|nr:hypothetical protein [Acidobacteriota bacterium]